MQGAAENARPRCGRFALASPAGAGKFGGVKSFRVLPLLFLGLLLAVRAAAQPVGEATDKVSEWNGYRRLDFEVAGRPCILVVPKTAAPRSPWIWRTEFFGHEPQADLALLAQGWHVAYMNAQDLYGSPKAMALFGQFYAHVVAQRGLAKRMVLEGLSRGGLYAVAFAAAHPTRVAAIYLDAPALDIKSWPGRNRQSKEWAQCLAAYELTEETLAGFKRNPIDLAPMLAPGKIPILGISGDADETVPYSENLGLFQQRYRAQGGTIEVILKPGGKHHPHSLVDPAPIVDFILKHARY